MYLGIDLGTSGVKAVLMTGDGKIAQQATAPLTVSRPQPLWSEQDPADWISAASKAITQLNMRDQVKAIGFSGQMHGATLLDKDDQIIRPAILWNDGRSPANCEAIEQAVPTSRNITGNIAMPGFTAPKLHWLRTHEADNFDRVAKVLLPKDYLRFWLTGDYASDMSDSAGTLWLDVGARDWSDEMLAATGLECSHMPALFEGSQATGILAAKIANELGLPAGVPVAAGGGDNAAGAVGIGVVKPGDAFLSLGTSGVYFVVSDGHCANPDGAVHAFCHALPDTWHQMAVMLSAASCLDWAAGITGQDVPSLLAAAERFAGDAPLFLPYLTGERTPHNDPNAKGVLFGMTPDHDAGAVGQAVLEGVAFGLLDGQSALEDAGSPIGDVTVIGGGARSAYWGKILASALNRPLIYREGGEVGPALGAARLAQLAAGEGSIKEVCAAPNVDFTVDPDPALRSDLMDRYSKWRELYQRLKPAF